MNSISLLIKPVSGSCNLRCGYCFYCDETENRSIKSYGIMSVEALDTIVKKALQYAGKSCTFGFQGGEPLLRGLDFYQELVRIQKLYNTKKITINNTIQTNGLLINDEWAEFFAAHGFLVGISLDGTKELHDRNRVDMSGTGTFSRVLAAVRVLERHKAEYNILTVVTSQLAKHIESVYAFYKKNNFTYQQFIPCLEPLGGQTQEPPARPYSLGPYIFAGYMKSLFRLWHSDIMRGEFVYNRQFENYVGILLGYEPENCAMVGRCSNQYLVEADGGVFPCDFYALDGYLLGNLTTDGFEGIEKKRRDIRFIEASAQLHPDCAACRWYRLCRGGCRRDREPVFMDKPAKNHFCGAYKDFFEYAIGGLREVAEKYQYRLRR